LEARGGVQCGLSTVARASSPAGSGSVPLPISSLVVLSSCARRGDGEGLVPGSGQRKRHAEPACRVKTWRTVRTAGCLIAWHDAHPLRNVEEKEVLQRVLMNRLTRQSVEGISINQIPLICGFAIPCRFLNWIGWYRLLTSINSGCSGLLRLSGIFSLCDARRYFRLMLSRQMEGNFVAHVSNVCPHQQILPAFLFWKEQSPHRMLARVQGDAL